MDLEMLEMDCYQAIRHIRAHEQGDFDPTIPLIALTAHSLPEVLEIIVCCGMNFMITKPVNFYRLSRVLTSLLMQNDPISLRMITADIEKLQALQPRNKEQ